MAEEPNLKEQWRGAACSVTPELPFWGKALALGCPLIPAWAMEGAELQLGGWWTREPCLCLEWAWQGSACMESWQWGAPQSGLRAALGSSHARIPYPPSQVSSVISSVSLLWTRLLSYLHTLPLLPNSCHRKEKETTGVYVCV